MFAQDQSGTFQQDKVSKAPLHCLSMFPEHIALKHDYKYVFDVSLVVLYHLNQSETSKI